MRRSRERTKGRVVPIEGGQSDAALRVVTFAQRDVRDYGAELVIVVVIRPDGARHVYTSTDDRERAIGALHRAAGGLDRNPP